MVNVSYEYRIYPTENQVALFNKILGLCRLYYNLIRVPSAYTLKRCSNCNNINPLVKLGVTNWICPKCNIFHDRDINAVLNILNFGIKMTLGREHNEVIKNARNYPRRHKTTVENVSTQVKDSNR